MKAIQILSKTISEIEEGFYDKSILLTDEQKEIFKTSVIEADSIAAIIISMSDKSIQKHDNQIELNEVSSAVFKIYEIDQNILTELSSYTGLSQKQIKSLKNACKEKIENGNKALCNLFESTALETELISYHKNKSLFKKSNNSNKSTEQFDSFIEYIVTAGNNSVILEQIARLSIYQKQQFQKHLETNLKLNTIYTKYVETGKITKTDIDYSRNQIEKQILKNLRDFPIQFIQEMDGTNIVKTANKSAISDSFLKGKAPATYIDAWGVSEGNLLGYCVTDNLTFDTQFNQIIRIADGIENGLKCGALQDIQEYELRGYCSSILGDDKDLTSSLNEQINDMINTQKITKQDFMALKYSAINKELLNIINLTPDALYEKIEGKISLGFHSDNSPLISIKNKNTQVLTSTQGVTKAISILTKIAKENPSLHKMETVFSVFANNLADGYSAAYSANLINGSTKETEDLLKEAKENLLTIQDTLFRCGTRNAQNFKFSLDDDETILRRNKIINETYAEQQLALSNNTISEQGFLKLTTAKHDVQISRNTANQVLSGNYNALVTQSLFNDCLNFKIQDVVEKANNSPSKNVHGGTAKQIANALKSGLEMGFDMDEVISNIHKHSNLAEKLIEVAGGIPIITNQQSTQRKARI